MRNALAVCLCQALLLPLLALTGISPAWAAGEKVTILSTSFVLERKFVLMEQAAEEAGIELAWRQVDLSTAGQIAEALRGTRLVIVDAPRSDDQSAIERNAGDALRQLGVPSLGVHVMSPPVRMRSAAMEEQLAQRLFEYYVGGTSVNHRRMFAYLQQYLNGGDLSQVPPPLELPNGGIYHPEYPELVFADLEHYLDWWQTLRGTTRAGKPVIGLEMSSSYLSDGQNAMLDAAIADIEARDAVPLAFYRSSRVARERSERSGDAASSGRGSSGSGRPAGGRPATTSMPIAEGDIFPGDAVVAGDARPDVEGVMNERDRAILTQNGHVFVDVVMVNTFLGSDPEGRKDWNQALDVPQLNLITYRGGSREAYYADTAGIDSFGIPYNLTIAEYVGLQDPVVIAANEDGELKVMPEQLAMSVGRAINQARLRRMNNADKKIALMFWNHPPGEHNQGASNLNVPRSLEALSSRLALEGYDVTPAAEQEFIDAVALLLSPRYRADGFQRLMATDYWDSLPLSRYEAWLATLPASVRERIEQRWGPAAESPWVFEIEGEPRFVIPRMSLGKMIVMPQPPRGESGVSTEEKDIFHDDKVPVHHAYLATYLWVREQFGANAIVHFGTHGSQEWLPGKERGLWAYDDPNLLVEDVPVIYPYIVDNIGEAIHVKRRGRGVIISHQTPPFTPAGLSDDFVVINNYIREYLALDEGVVKENNRNLIIEQAVAMNIHSDLGWSVAELESGFENFLRDIEDYLEEVGLAMQPLGLHSFGETALPEHRVTTVMQMLGEPLYQSLGIEDVAEVFAQDYTQIQESTPYRFVMDKVFSNTPLESFDDPAERDLIEKGRRFDAMLDARSETEGILRALSSRFVDPSYGGDSIRNPDALQTGRNVYGFDPSRIPTQAAYAAGVDVMQGLILSHEQTHGEFPQKLAFTMWSTETMRHLGMLEAEIMAAMGVKPVWDQSGTVVDVEIIPLAQLGRPRIDPVISLTGLYRDQFPNVMEWFNKAIVLVANLDEPGEDNLIRRNTETVYQELLADGVDAETARDFALTRIYGNESGDYGTGLTDASLASDQWDEGDTQLEELYLSRMSWGYGPDKSRWSSKPSGADGAPISAYAAHLRGTSAAVFSRSSNLKGLLDTDHPFEYLGGISKAVQYLDGEAPQLYISNMRDPARAKLQTAERFMAMELRAVYQHPNWLAEMQQEGYAGTLSLLNTINNFWGWQVMDRNVVRDDQWQEFEQVYVMDRYELGVREWFEENNPEALAQIAERMLEAVRKDYWDASEQTVQELVATYVDIAERYDIVTSNQTFLAYVEELAAGYGLSAPGSEPAAAEANPDSPTESASSETLETVTGQVLTQVLPQEQEPVPVAPWMLVLLALFVIGILRRDYQMRAWDRILKRSPSYDAY
ncbi:MAG: cobaltochelatase subunit CobN [Pseudomonadales bacterium]|nr:cobaltochelatase subunit CobN [Pseudomonadales bacterium]